MKDLQRVTPLSFTVMKKIIKKMNAHLEYGEESPQGLNELISLIFENENLQVIKNALELMNHLVDSSDEHNVGVFKEGFLEKCLSRLY